MQVVCNVHNHVVKHADDLRPVFVKFFPVNYQSGRCSSDDEMARARSASVVAYYDSRQLLRCIFAACTVRLCVSVSASVS